MTGPDAASVQRPLAAQQLAAQQLAGFRVLRSLARDDAAEVLLGHRMAGSDEQTGATTVAVKVSTSTNEAWQAAVHQCAALERARGAHVVELRDVDADDSSICLVFERLPRGDLAEVLRMRERLEAGEAVTLLAPIVGTLLRLHAAGVAHGAVSAGTVLFRDDGSPAMIGFSGAELFEPGAPEIVLEAVGAVQRDRESTRSLAVSVLGRVTGSRAHAARALLADVQACDAELVLEILTSRLFEVAAAMPVRFEPDDPVPDAASPTPRVVPVRDAAAEPGAAPSRSATLLGALVPESLVQRVLDSTARSPVGPTVARGARVVANRWRSWAPRRRRVVLAIGAAAVTVAVVTAVAPASGALSEPPSGSAGIGASASGPLAGLSPTPSTTSARRDPAETADDPVAAAVALLRDRERCLGTLSVICLDGVDEPGSGALEDDQATIRTAQQGGELPDPVSRETDSGPPVLIERLGDSALVRLGSAASRPGTAVSATPTPSERGPASLLLVKGEVGWRIRDVIAVGPNDGPGAAG